MKKLYFSLFSFLFVLIHSASAQTFTGIDIWQGAGSSGPYGFTAFNGKVYFSAQGDTTTTGYELYVSDGTQAGTRLVKDIWPGPSSSYVSEQMAVVDTLLFFSADDGVHGSELWVTDGTDSGTRMVLDIWPGPSGSSVNNLTPYNGKVYFTADDSVHGDELWVSDGTAAGTVMVKDIWTGVHGSGPQGFAVGPGTYYYGILNVINGKLYFRADDGIHGYELWTSDGTTLGTQMVADILPGPGSSYPFFMTPFNGGMIFSANDSIDGFELYTSDGTAGGTSLLKNINPGSLNNAQGADVADYTGFVPMNGKLYFSAFQPATGYELWSTDGTSLGTTLVADIWPGPNSSAAGSYYALTAFNGKLYFAAQDSLNGDQLWSSDGTAGGTSLVKVLSSYIPDESSPDHFLTYNGQLIFTASIDSTNLEQLWASDGTAGGTHIIAPAIAPNPNPMGSFNAAYTPYIVANGSLFMNANFNSIGDELWVYGFPVGITPVSGDNTITAYPNPFTTSLTLSGLEGSGHYTVQIVDMTGREYYSTEISQPAQQTLIAMPAIATGVYLMHVSGQGSTQTFKLVKN